MPLLEFYPENNLERLIAEAKAARKPINEVMSDIFASDLYISSKSEVNQDGSGFEPLLLGKDNEPLIAAFSSLSRPSIHSHVAQYILRLNGKEFFRRIPSGYGVILNPGFVAQLIISPSAVAAFRGTR